MSAGHFDPSQLGSLSAARVQSPGDARSPASAAPAPMVPAKITVPLLRARKMTGEKIVALTVYDYPTGRLCDEAGVDLVLVGDSLANVVLGYENTLGVSLEEMLIATQAVKRGVRRALIVGDLPFGTYQRGPSEAIEAGIAFVKAGAEAVKLEGGRRRAELVRQLVEAEIPVMGHVGLTPQSVNAMGGYKVQGKNREAGQRLLEDALSLEEAGAFSVVIEGVPSPVAAEITRHLQVPTVGIGAGGGCDGQILVLGDLLGIVPGRKPKFVRQYLDVHALALDAIRAYRRDVQDGEFPSRRESYEVRGVPSS